MLGLISGGLLSMSPILGQRLLAPVRQLQGAAGTAVANCSSQAAFVSKHFRSPPKEFGEVATDPLEIVSAI